jgi:HAD superfamily hydrolase (TIGR01484 family)
MKDSYALFFDIDGTLVSFKTHEIPDSTIQALTQAKENGSRVYIATGRPPIIITNLGAIAMVGGFPVVWLVSLFTKKMNQNTIDSIFQCYK